MKGSGPASGVEETHGRRRKRKESGSTGRDFEVAVVDEEAGSASSGGADSAHPICTSAISLPVPRFGKHIDLLRNGGEGTAHRSSRIKAIERRSQAFGLRV